MKDVMEFEKKRKLSPVLVEDPPVEITKRVDLVAYRIALPTDLAGMHVVLHMSVLRFEDLMYMVHFFCGFGGRDRRRLVQFG
jgi:hypothetical protein